MTPWEPQSCTLPTTEQPLRVSEFDALFVERVADTPRPSPHPLEGNSQPHPRVGPLDLPARAGARTSRGCHR
jgi:hypothetical protein